MSLDQTRLEKPRLRGGKLIARCPACAETGGDKSCEHLFIADEGRGAFGCVVNPGPAGHAHRQRIWELAGERLKPGHARSRPFLRPLPLRKAPDKPLPFLPPLRALSVAEMAQVANLRDWQFFVGLELLGRRGLLWHGMVWDDGREWPAWIITDATRRNAQARRIDGGLWTGINSKAKSLPGSDPSWPIGAAEIKAQSFVLLCEGQPDFCAALLVAWHEGVPAAQVASVCMTGAGNSIHLDALPLFAGKHVRIAVHADDAGRRAGEQWARQLYAAGAARVDGFDFDGLTMSSGRLVKDLADFATRFGPDATAAPRVLAQV